MELYVKNKDLNYIYKVEYKRDCDSTTLCQVYALTLICGYDYEDLDDKYNNKQCYVSANNFIDEVQYEEIIAYPLEETLKQSLIENGYETIDKLPIIKERGI